MCPLGQSRLGNNGDKGMNSPARVSQLEHHHQIALWKGTLTSMQRMQSCQQSEERRWLHTFLWNRITDLVFSTIYGYSYLAFAGPSDIRVGWGIEINGRFEVERLPASAGPPSAGRAAFLTPMHHLNSTRPHGLVQAIFWHTCPDLDLGLWYCLTHLTHIALSGQWPAGFVSRLVPDLPLPFIPTLIWLSKCFIAIIIIFTCSLHFKKCTFYLSIIIYLHTVISFHLFWSNTKKLTQFYDI